MPRIEATRSGIGAELIAAAYFLEQQFDVFKSVTGKGPFDLAVYKNEQLFRVEVKAITLAETPANNENGVAYRSITFSAPANDEWDLLALVDRNTHEVLVYDKSKSIAEIRAELRVKYLGEPDEPTVMACGATVRYILNHLDKCTRCQKINSLRPSS